MIQDLKSLWLAALRSGKYTQGVGKLHAVDYDDNHSYCCLGVLCDVAGIPAVLDFRHYVYAYSSALLPVGFNIQEHPAIEKLIFMNDNLKSFDEIADYIEANIVEVTYTPVGRRF